MDFGQKIKAGYVIRTATWENDANHYKTLYNYGFTREEAAQWIVILQWYSHAQSDLGNKEFDIDIFLERLFEYTEKGLLTKEFVKTQFGIEILGNTIEECFSSFLPKILGEFEDTIMDTIVKFLDRAVDYDYNFCRVIDIIKVLYIKEDIIIPEIPILQEFNGDYWASKEQWVLNNEPISKDKA